ncbi:hypothetical protein SALB_00931 [Streptomyces noursei]|uniref:Uncharacterized protein n=1 Tax=Streptomyces noursei TaxID=1971 RepID=A0A401QS85_STRNR|nr:hypothetical protein SALB_00931 [Streptomyces noursei]
MRDRQAGSARSTPSPCRLRRRHLSVVALRRVVFAGADRYGPHGPAITYEQLRDLVAADRGAGYVPCPAEASSW